MEVGAPAVVEIPLVMYFDMHLDVEEDDKDTTLSTYGLVSAG
jgi:hypothetical protein